MQPLIGNNYHTWSRLVLMALTAKNKIGFMNGAISKPSYSHDPLFLLGINAKHDSFLDLEFHIQRNCI